MIPLRGGAFFDPNPFVFGILDLDLSQTGRKARRGSSTDGPGPILPAGPADPVLRLDSAEAARLIADATARLKVIAKTHQFDTLDYLLGMAEMEAADQARMRGKRKPS